MNTLAERAAWLAGDVLLLAGTGANGAVEASATVAKRPRDITTRTLALHRNGTGTERLLIASRFATPPAGEADKLSLTLASGAEEVSLDPAQLAGSLTDPAAFLREGAQVLLADIDADAARGFLDAEDAREGR